MKPPPFRGQHLGVLVGPWLISRPAYRRGPTQRGGPLATNLTTWKTDISLTCQIRHESASSSPSKISSNYGSDGVFEVFPLLRPSWSDNRMEATWLRMVTQGDRTLQLQPDLPNSCMLLAPFHRFCSSPYFSAKHCPSRDVCKSRKDGGCC